MNWSATMQRNVGPEEIADYKRGRLQAMTHNNAEIMDNQRNQTELSAAGDMHNLMLQR